VTSPLTISPSALSTSAGPLLDPPESLAPTLVTKYQYFRNNFNSVLVVRLQELLTCFSLKKSGRKLLLIKRLQCHIDLAIDLLNKRSLNSVKGIIIKWNLSVDGSLDILIERAYTYLRESIASTFLSRESKVTPVILKSYFTRDTCVAKILGVLRDTDVFKSTDFNVTDADKFLDPILWTIPLEKNRSNVDNFFAEKESQLSARRMKLVKLNNELIVSFASGNIAAFCDSTIWSEIVHCCLFELCHEFISICWNIDYMKENILGISEVVEYSMMEEIDVLLETAHKKKLEVLYCVSGWALHAMKRVATCRIIETREAMNFLIGLATVDAEIARTTGLPTGKIDRVVAFGGLVFSPEEFFENGKYIFFFTIRRTFGSSWFILVG